MVLITPASAINDCVDIHSALFPGGALRGQLEYLDTVAPPIPEPETDALLLAGPGVAGFAARRRRQAA